MLDLNEFKKDLGELTKEQFVSTHISDRLPFVFDDSWKDFREWTTQAANLLDVDSKNVTIVGSAACGVSLNPHKNFKLFDGSSDVDVAVISTYHFDLAWRLLRRTNLSEARGSKELNAINDHKSRLIYWGCVATDKILRLLPFGAEWSRAKIKLSSHPAIEGRTVNFRLYRDYESLRLYQVNSISGVRI